METVQSVGLLVTHGWVGWCCFCASWVAATIFCCPVCTTWVLTPSHFHIMKKKRKKEEKKFYLIIPPSVLIPVSVSWNSILLILKFTLLYQRNLDLFIDWNWVGWFIFLPRPLPPPVLFFLSSHFVSGCPECIGTNSSHRSQSTLDNGGFMRTLSVFPLTSVCIHLLCPLHWQIGLPQIFGHEPNRPSEERRSNGWGRSPKGRRNEGRVPPLALCCMELMFPCASTHRGGLSSRFCLVPAVCSFKAAFAVMPGPITVQWLLCGGGFFWLLSTEFD